MNMLLNPFTQDSDGQLRTLSVSELSGMVKNILETSFNIVRIKGEIIGLKKSPSGHFYFDLKEKVDGTDFVVNAIIWKWAAPAIVNDLENGQSVVAIGKVSSYSGRSSYNLIVESIELEGVGNLLKEIEERRKRLEIQGIFEVSHKKKIPFIPNRIGVITSESGAVIRDILHRLSDRFPVHILLQSVNVQGESAKNEITKAIKNFDSMSIKDGRPDVVIVARGGGSLQDLMVFNDEDIVMAVYNCSIPIISAIGHETDYTLIDYVSDLRAPTPTASAEFAVPVISDLIQRIQEKNSRMYSLIDINLTNLFDKIYGKFKVLKNPIQIVNDLSIRLDDRIQLIDLSIKNKLYNIEEKMKSVGHILDNLSFKNVLKRGYAIVWNNQNKIVSRIQEFAKTDTISVEFFDGKCDMKKSATDIFVSEKCESLTTQNDSKNAIAESNKNIKKSGKKNSETYQGNLF